MTALLQAMQPLFAVAFTLGTVPVSWLEAVAFVLSIVMVACNIRVNVLAWPLAIVTSLMYLALFWQSRLYGGSALQLLFIAVAGWGWWQWLHGSGADGRPLRVTWLGARGCWAAAAALALAWPATALLLHSTDTDVPWWDAFPTAASVVNQWLVGRKHVESWAVWIVVNGVALALFAYKGLWLTALLYAVFIPMCVAGWRAWAAQAAQAARPQAVGSGGAAPDAPAPPSR